jgi:hypothetical protein
MSTTNTLTAPTQVVAPVTYADVVKSAQTLKLSDVCDVKTFDKMPEHLKTVIMADLVKRVNMRKQEALGETLTAIDTAINKINPDVLTAIRELMSANDITTVNVRITADTFGIVKQLDKPTSTRAVGTSSKTSKYTYYLNDNMITGGSSDVATALGIDVTTDQYKKANGWLKIAVQAKAQGATITRTNADNDTIEQFAPEATTKEAHAVWFAKQ